MSKDEKQKLLMEQPVRFERDGNQLTQINEGWVTEDKEMFSRLLRKETFYYLDGTSNEDPDKPSTVVIETLETLKGTMYMKRKLRGKLFDDV